ncbi:hypothetical protein E2C01_065461 [Portunus trituberculatus]|uniref:Uncharacterized protein n=1 Tax=Portunus trituberculatus TaxID=210409 RepID=A0A5B7HN77_PORTR|nr:hypothetical protein [Portunus trituberculatus]
MVRPQVCTQSDRVVAVMVRPQVCTQSDRVVAASCRHFSFSHQVRWVETWHSINLPEHGRRAMGRYADGRAGSLPGLGIGIRVENFQVVGL